MPRRACCRGRIGSPSAGTCRLLSVNRRVAKSLPWVFWSRGLLQGLSLLSTAVVARLLDPEDYGLIALIALCVVPLAGLIDLGTGAAIIQHQGLEDSDLNLCFWLTMAASAAAGCLVSGLAPGLAGWFRQPSLTPALRVSAFTLPLAAARSVPDALLRKRLQLDRISQVEITAGVVGIPLVLGLAAIGAGVWSLVAGMLASAALQTVATFKLAWWIPGFRLRTTRLLPLLAFGLKSMGNNFCWTLYQQADTFVLGRVAGATPLGFYTLAKQLAMLVVEKTSSIATLISTPLMAHLQTDLPALRHHLLRSLRLAAWLCIPPTAALAAVAHDLVLLTLGPKWIPLVPVLQVLCLSAAVRSVAVHLPPALMARYRVGFLLRYSALLLGVMPVAFYAGAISAGPLGVAVAWAVAYPALTVLLLRKTALELSLSRRALLSELAPPVLTSLLILLLATAIAFLLPGQGLLVTAARLTLTFGVMSAVYLLGLMAFGTAVRNDLTTLVRCLLRPARTVPAAR